MFALCNPSVRDCLAKHKAILEDPQHKHRRPTGKRGPTKAKGRPRGKDASAHKRQCKGSRSGASASFDSRNFQRRRRVTSDDEEEDDGDEEDGD